MNFCVSEQTTKQEQCFTITFMFTRSSFLRLPALSLLGVLRHNVQREFFDHEPRFCKLDLQTKSHRMFKEQNLQETVKAAALDPVACCVNLSLCVLRCFVFVTHLRATLELLLLFLCCSLTLLLGLRSVSTWLQKLA